MTSRVRRAPDAAAVPLPTIPQSRQAATVPQSRQAATIPQSRLVTLPETVIIELLHFARDPYVGHVLVSTCNSIFMIWILKKLRLAREGVDSVLTQLRIAEERAVAAGDNQGGLIRVREIMLELVEARDVI